MFALGVLAILAAIALPNWGTLLPSYYLNSATRQVQSELHNSKSRATAQNISYRLNFSTNQSYKIEKDPGSGWQDSGENKPLPEGIKITGDSDTALGFTSRGTATPGVGGTIKLCNNRSEGKNVVVSSTGRIRTENATCTYPST
ncbi:MAG: GspH/FimT family pseudopilin [Deltaproteobacteria bacterium]|nr:GspH/FimT family pseudopilin [Deltaproteobacteria bacterium]